MLAFSFVVGSGVVIHLRQQKLCQSLELGRHHSSFEASLASLIERGDTVVCHSWQWLCNMLALLFIIGGSGFVIHPSQQKLH